MSPHVDLIPGIINVFSFRTIKSEKLPPPLNEIFIHVWFENFFHSFQNLTYLFLHLLPFLILFLIMFFFFFFQGSSSISHLISCGLNKVKFKSSQLSLSSVCDTKDGLFSRNQSQNSLQTTRTLEHEQDQLRWGHASC